MTNAYDWDPASYKPSSPLQPLESARDKPEQWFRDNAAVFHALEEWRERWLAYAANYEHVNDRPPSSLARDKNKAAFRRALIKEYGRGEPDAAWLELRIQHLEKRGQMPERSR